MKNKYISTAVVSWFLSIFLFVGLSVQVYATGKNDHPEICWECSKYSPGDLVIITGYYSDVYGYYIDPGDGLGIPEGYTPVKATIEHLERHAKIPESFSPITEVKLASSSNEAEIIEDSTLGNFGTGFNFGGFNLLIIILYSFLILFLFIYFPKLLNKIKIWNDGRKITDSKNSSPKRAVDI